MADLNESTNRLPLPKGVDQPFIGVSALEAGHLDLPYALLVSGAPQSEVRECPSLSFFLQHSASGKRLVFDLGLRKDTTKLPPATLEQVKKYTEIDVKQDVYESLANAGLYATDIDYVIISHVHFDHVGDPSIFIKESQAIFVVGEGSADQVGTGYTKTESAEVLASSLPTESSRRRVLSKQDFNQSIGPFSRAHDFFGDGSLYIIDAAGHLSGHINLLVRTSSDGSWLYLAADTAHDRRLISGEKEIAVFTTPSGDVRCVHSELQEAKRHIERVRALSSEPRVQVILAHDWEWYEANRSTAFLPGVILPL